MTRGLSGVSPANVQRYLEGVEYPASKRDLIRQAERNRAPEEIMDLIDDLPHQDYDSPVDVQRAYGQEMRGENGGSQRRERQDTVRARRFDEDEEERRPERGQERQGRGEERSEGTRRARRVVFDLLQEHYSADLDSIREALHEEGIQGSPHRVVNQLIREGHIEIDDDGMLTLSDFHTGEHHHEEDSRTHRSRQRGESSFRSSGRREEQSSGRREEQSSGRREEQSSGRREEQGNSRGGDGQQRSRSEGRGGEETESHRRPKDPEREREIEERAHEYEERGGSRRSTDDDPWDHRLRGHESPAINAARHMEHGYDGRGVARDPSHDRRLKGQETEAIRSARHMEHGYDGRGRVRKFGPGDIEPHRSEERYESAEDRHRREQSRR